MDDKEPNQGADEPTPEVTTDSKTTAKKMGGSRLKTVLLSVLIVLLVAASAGAAYWLRDRSAKTTASEKDATIASLKKSNAALEKDLAAAKATTGTNASSNSCTVQQPNAAAISNIEASITSGNTQALEGYMASSVKVILAATEAYGAQTPTQAVSDVTNFISTDSSSWDYNFSLPASTLSSYSSGDYSEYFPATALVGKASNGKVISFSFDCNAKISTVFLADQM